MKHPKKARISTWFLVELKRMLQEPAKAVIKRTITIEMCADDINVRKSFAVLVSKTGSERSPGFVIFEEQANTITKSILPSSGKSVQ